MKIDRRLWIRAIVGIAWLIGWSMALSGDEPVNVSEIAVLFAGLAIIFALDVWR